MWSRRIFCAAGNRSRRSGFSSFFRRIAALLVRWWLWFCGVEKVARSARISASAHSPRQVRFRVVVYSAGRPWRVTAPVDLVLAERILWVVREFSFPSDLVVDTRAWRQWVSDNPAVHVDLVAGRCVTLSPLGVHCVCVPVV
jgi:hypothetical protein